VAEESLGQRIRRLRHERGLSLAQVAGGEFSRAFLNQVELGKSQPSTRVLRIIASRLDARLDYLLEGSAPMLDREIALEKGRVAVARGNHRRALADLEPAVDTDEWPLGCDARLCAAQALLGLGRVEEAERLLQEEERRIRQRRDPARLRRLRAIRQGRSGALTASAHVRQAERALRAGQGQLALDHYRSARILLEATGRTASPTSRTAEAGSRPAASPRA
jgi:transcriptional regulator with XRE-family HTH domain